MTATVILAVCFLVTVFYLVRLIVKVLNLNAEMMDRYQNLAERVRLDHLELETRQRPSIEQLMGRRYGDQGIDSAEEVEGDPLQ